MITAGIDMGAKTIKVVIVKDNKIVARSMNPTGFEPVETAEKTLQEAIKQAGILRGDIKKIFTTGAGRKSIPFADNSVLLISAPKRPEA